MQVPLCHVAQGQKHPGEVAVSDWGSLPDSSDDKEKTYKSFQGIFHLISHSGTGHLPGDPWE